MYLSRLEIIGFKSFAQKTNLKFIDGITALVGPNGCGKTNIVDAIRWVLGEQKSAILRSDIMEDVIFNGTKSRKPLSMSEVSLTLENNKKILPIEFNEVTITRRLFRNGESNYLINNTICRLRDIVDMFMDTGMGADSYSVIELKMVEAILSGKPEERRHLMEEAAGVTKYKVRRKEAGKKLMAVQSDLLRLQDLVSEVEKNVNSLSRQAAKTRKYNKLHAQLRDLETELIKYEYLEYSENLEKLLAEHYAVNAYRTTQDNILGESEDYLKQIEKRYHLLDEEHQKAMESENLLSGKVSKKTRDIDVSREKVNFLGKEHDRINHEINESGDFLENSGNILVTLNYTKKNTLERITDSIRTLNIKKEELKTLGDNVSDRRQLLNSSNENLKVMENERNSKQTVIKKNELRKTAIDQKLDDSLSGQEKFKNQINDHHNLQDGLKEDLQLAESKLQELENFYTSAQEKQTALLKNIEELQNEVYEQKAGLAGETSTYEFLSNLFYEDESIKFLLDEPGWKNDGHSILLAEAVGADESHRVAVEAALGEFAHYFVVRSTEEAKNAISLLHKSAKGKAGFICLEMVPEFNLPELSKKLKGTLGWLSEIVRVDDNLRHFLRILFGKTVLVEDLEKAFNIVKQKEVDCAVTIHGEFVRFNSAVKGGSVLKKEGLTVGKMERLEQLINSIKILNDKIAALENQLQGKKQEYASINLQELSSELRNTQNTVNDIKSKSEQNKYRIEALNNSLTMLEQNKDSLNRELSGIDDENQQVLSEISSIDSELESIREIINEQQHELKNEEDNLYSAREESSDIEMELVKLQTELTGIDKELLSTQSQIKINEEKITLLKKSISENSKSIDELQKLITTNEAELIGLQEKAEEASTASDLLFDQKKQIEEQISIYANDLTTKRKDLEKYINTIHQLEIKINSIRTHIDDLINRSVELYGFEPSAGALTLNPEFSLQEQKMAITSLKDRLSALGNINFEALEQFEEESRRFEFLKAQIKDLAESEKILQETISEINKTAEERFKKTFTEVNANLSKLFKSLFGNEGEAELRLNNDNPLEADIEIIAKPPGKKPNSINMLSGGEKTLTSIALLFAIYLVKPSPFCILDEVDAPLDDSNIDRFLKMIREFSTNTQFMIVTHNKRTMEFADALYGITMEEEGITKVVSVRLSQPGIN